MIHLLMNPIESKYFTFNKFVNNFNMKTFLDENSSLPGEKTDSDNN